MDELNSNFGRLSTQAAEWKPRNIPTTSTTTLIQTPGVVVGLVATAIGSQQQQQQSNDSSNKNSTQAVVTATTSIIASNNNKKKNIHSTNHSNNHATTATTLKEFVPGKGWSTTTTTTSTTTELTTTSTTSTEADSSQQQQSHNQSNNISYDSTTPSPAAALVVVDVDVSIPNVSSSLPPYPDEYRSLHSFGLTDESWRYYRDMNVECTRQMDPYDPLHKAVPLPYCNAYCLDANSTTPTTLTTTNQTPPQQIQQSVQRNGNHHHHHTKGPTRSIFFGYPSITFQVTNRDDGYLYCLRRYDNVRSVSTKIAVAVTDMWNSCPDVQDHPGIVPFYHCFVAQRAVFFVHHYIPKSRSLKEILLNNNNTGTATSITNTSSPVLLSLPLSENILWSCLTQLISAIRVIHRNHLAVRALRLQHVLYTISYNHANPHQQQQQQQHNHNNLLIRVRLAGLGIVDALEFEARKHVLDLQMDDIRNLGRLLLSLATGTEVTVNTDQHTVMNCESYLLQQYSRELHTIITRMIHSNPHPIIGGSNRSSPNHHRQQQQQPSPTTIFDICHSVATLNVNQSGSNNNNNNGGGGGNMNGTIFSCYDEMDKAHRFADQTVRCLISEYDSGRALRLLLKLGFVNERPEFGQNRRWSQSGDCYVLTLFRDYVFHQADGAGNPVLDLGHVITALNKLDAAVEEKIVLTSRDGKSWMVVSYADVARCLDSAYQELCLGAVTPASLFQQQQQHHHHHYSG